MLLLKKCKRYKNGWKDLRAVYRPVAYLITWLKKELPEDLEHNLKVFWLIHNNVFMISCVDIYIIK